ncbi:ATP-dependent RNA helicase RhlE [uncultured Pleomorphomonas sp.]|uniref:DEAD-box ATP-dependent RNA helicase RhpA n=1 Tax=uncultured Pleomorphomonas sp. TaxID=442121 RepID=A0A212L2Y3_9HYPH|nr:ATP-dependent RNA helicase RhlE [uncultured Pleomorphomonas sp.]
MVLKADFPLTSFSDFGLADSLTRALVDAGYETPTPIQTQAIPDLLKGRDLLGIAQTGTGKTAAFALPILQRLSAGRPAQPRRVRALILSPTRELATQIAESFKTYSRYMNHMSIAVVFGGVGHRPQEDRLKRGVDILVATPGRLMDHMAAGMVSLESTEIFVLDEADQMLDMGFVQPVRRIVKHLPKARHSLFFSATMPKEIGQLAGELLFNPVTVSVAPAATTVERVDQRVIHVEAAAKRRLLLDVIVAEKPERALIFTRTKHGADRVVRQLGQDGVDAAAIHGNKSQAQREKALAAFKAGSTPILVATDIAARGIDVTGVSHVINFDLPNIPESYVHRIGRTARAGASGVAISFCAEDERPYLKDIEKVTRQKIPAEDRRGTIALAERSETSERGERPAGKRPQPGDRRGSHRPAPPAVSAEQQRRDAMPAAKARQPGAAKPSHAAHGKPGQAKASQRPVHRDTGAAEESLGRVGFLAGGRDGLKRRPDGQGRGHRDGR